MTNARTVLVTGATGLAGANICRQLVERGDTVRALARPNADTGPLADLGVQIVTGDVTEADDVRRAAKGCDSAIHSAALLGGSSQNMADFEAVNTAGTRHLLDAAEAEGLGRVVAVSTSTFFDMTTGLDREDAPVKSEEKLGNDPYTVTKRAAFLDAMARAERGMNVVTTHPGAIFGPSPVASNALGKTSFNRVLLSALRRRVERYLTFPVSWVFADDIATGCLLALDRGVAGERYMLDGQPEDVVSTAQACNQICRVAGVDHHVADLPPSDDPAVLEIFGPTLLAIARKLAADQPPRRPLADTKTFKRLGYNPISLDEGLTRTAAWMRDLGQFG